jgi:hypothetical protein
MSRVRASNLRTLTIQHVMLGAFNTFAAFVACRCGVAIGCPTNTESSMGRVILVVTGVAAAAAATVFLVVGLDHGDKLASMLGAIVAVLALGLTVYQLAAGSHSQSAPAGSSSKYNVHVTRSWFVKIGDGE